jgi:hypothetical protein
MPTMSRQAAQRQRWLLRAVGSRLTSRSYCPTAHLGNAIAVAVPFARLGHGYQLRVPAVSPRRCGPRRRETRPPAGAKPGPPPALEHIGVVLSFVTFGSRSGPAMDNRSACGRRLDGGRGADGSGLADLSGGPRAVAC